jgi:HD-GYP domain-containing protein (c-di-GMP phosphodiesterase class II)
MTVSRPYSSPKGTEEALRECEGLAGAQFSERAVESLHQLHRAGLLREASAEVRATVTGG